MRVRVPLWYWIPLIVVGLATAYFVVDWNISGDEVTDYDSPKANRDDELVDVPDAYREACAASNSLARSAIRVLVIGSCNASK
jgi:hypothetical protein